MRIGAFARRNARQNKSIILMVALCCMLIGTVVNLGFAEAQSVRDNLIAMHGEHHVTLPGVTEEQIKALSTRPEVALADVRRSLNGIGEISGEENKTILLTYASVLGLSQALPLTEGRAPETEAEAAIPPHAAELLGIEAAVGTEFSLDFLPWDEYGNPDPSRRVTFRFVVSGILPEQGYNRALGTVPIYLSEALAKQYSPAPTLLLTMKGNDPRGAVMEVCAAAGIHPQNILYNEAIITMNTTDPSLVAFIAVLVLILCGAGSLVVYNAYNLSIEKKIHQYGLLILLGASKKQIRSCVRIEAVYAVLFGLPFGLLGAVLAGFGSVNLLQGLVNGELHYSLSPGALILSGAVTLGTVLFGASRPAKRAAKIVPVEAVRFAAASETPVERNRLENVTPDALAKLDMTRNRRRFIGTVASLTLSGVLFLGIATVAVSMLYSADRLAEQMTTGDMTVTLASDRATYNADGTVASIDDPITPRLMDEIGAVDGVERVEAVAIQRLVGTESLSNGTTYSYYLGAIAGLPPESLQEVLGKVYEGTPTLSDFEVGLPVIAVIPTEESIETYRGYDVGIDEILAPYTLGATLDMPLDSRRIEDEGYRIPLKIVGLVRRGDVPNYIQINSFYPDLYTLASLFESNGLDNRTQKLILTLEEGKEQTAEDAVRALCAEGGDLETESFTAVKAEITRQLLGITLLVFLILAVIALIGFLNLLGSIFMGVEQRKRELGVLMAIGLSRKGVARMLTREGIWVSVFCTLFSGLAGLGLGVGLYHLLIRVGADYLSFCFPLWPFVSLCAVYGLVPYGITMAAVQRLRRFTPVELLGRQT